MFARSLALAALMAATLPAPGAAQMGLSDVQMAHVAVTASDIDIAYAHLALALSEDPAIRGFAEMMIRDHSAVNGQVTALATKLNIMAEDNPTSRSLLADAARIKDEMSRLRGAAFDAYYAKNELAYHRAVNGLVEGAFIPKIQHPEVKRAFQGALGLFRAHERHAEQLAAGVGMMGMK